MADIFEKFSNNFKNSLKAAADLALELSHEEINSQHILYGLAIQQGSVGAELFTSFKIKAAEIKSNIAKFNQTASKKITVTTPKFSSQAKKNYPEINSDCLHKPSSLCGHRTLAGGHPTVKRFERRKNI